MQMTAIVIKRESGVSGVKNGAADLTRSPLPGAIGEAVSVMKVAGGKQLENCCNLAGNVI